MNRSVLVLAELLILGAASPVFAAYSSAIVYGYDATTGSTVVQDGETSLLGEHVQASLGSVPGYGFSGSAEAEARAYSSVGGRAEVSDPLSFRDHYAIGASGEANSVVRFHAMKTGTVIYSVALNADLSVNVDTVYANQASIQGGTGMRWTYGYPFPWNPVSGSGWNGGATLSYSSSGGLAMQTGGLDEAEYAYNSSGQGSVSATRSFLVELPKADVDYELTLGLNAGAAADSRYGANDAFGSTNAMNSLGFPGDFYDIVGGTASFYDLDDPSRTYNIPEPSSFALAFSLLALLCVVLGRWRWRHRSEANVLRASVVNSQ